MKGTFFSADFVADKNDNLRLIEINTDTGAVNSQKYIFDWSDFISVLSTNNITEVDVIYKYDVQSPILETLSASLAENAPFITSYRETVVPNDSIFPFSPEDADNKFILRFAYDELAILDSEYAKGTLGLLKLFADAGDKDSVIGFYHSSSLHGEYNTIDTSLTNASNIPDIISKTVTELHTAHTFYKIGNSESSSVERLQHFIDTTTDSNTILEEYHLSADATLATNKAASQRTFQIVYGPNLDLCYVAEFEIPAVFELPTTIEYDDAQIANELSKKHYYEFATNHIKNNRHGFLGDTTIVDITGSMQQIADIVIGDEFQSYYVEGAPNTDDEDVLRTWKHTGSEIPSGSYPTSSVCVAKTPMNTFATELTRLTFDNNESFYVGGETRLLTYNIEKDYINYERVLNLEPNKYAVLNNSGSYTTITAVDCVLFDEPQIQYTLNMEDVDNFILEVGGGVTSFFVVHNLIGSCFPAGTKITLEGGSTANIEDIKIGDEVLSLNEKTSTIEPKKVIGLKQPMHNDLVKLHFANDTNLICTFDHPIYVNGYDLASFAPAWTNQRYEIGKEVGMVKVGDVVKIDKGGFTTIKQIEVLKQVDTQTYIITVEDNHNFFANNILVHNK